MNTITFWQTRKPRHRTRMKLRTCSVPGVEWIMHSTETSLGEVACGSWVWEWVTLEALPRPCYLSIISSLLLNCSFPLMKGLELQEVLLDLADSFYPCECGWTQKQTCLRVFPDRDSQYPICSNPEHNLWYQVQNAHRRHNLWKPQEILPELPQQNCQGKLALR